MATASCLEYNGDYIYTTRFCWKALLDSSVRSIHRSSTFLKVRRVEAESNIDSSRAMNLYAGSPYVWPAGPQNYWTNGPPTPFAQLTPKLAPAMSLPLLHPVTAPSWIMTPLPSQFQLPAAQSQYPASSPPEENDLPPLIAYPSNEESNNLPITIPNPTPWGLPPLPPGPAPYGYMVTPLSATPAIGVSTPRRRRKRRASTVNVSQPAVITPVPLMYMPGWLSKGRPSHWRPGYKANACTRLKSCFRKPTCVSSTHSLHPLIACDTVRRFPLLLDLRSPHTTVVFHHPQRHSNLVDLHQLATNPPTHEMQLHHPLLPWYVDVTASTPSGITIGDILLQLCNDLETSIAPTDFYNDVLSADDREQIVYAYQMRNGGSPKGMAQGMCKVDFLGPEVLFRGLTRAKEGWLMKTVSLY